MSQPGQRVRPGADLEQMRPELLGARGEVLWSEKAEVVVQWDGKPKPYRVPKQMIDPITR